ncbi:hypothetical protein GCM10022415_25450 [Knoellia locipacati]|uniref:Uncharacterized protein n=1 Tax=Knoellia locipacati TaxID=882824 RepID=A0A512T2S8_9MICO|nr:hypothetical protein [Knoellia locipacati]GEQ14494.1 hypothetical protein KLO01_25410 [Knoellia locipacati]
MSSKINAALNRRSALRVGAVGAAATAATVVTATGAEAAAGQPVLQGLSNAAGAAGTTLVSNGSAITLTVKNTGPGAAAFFFGQNNNGFAGGTGSGSKYGLSAANTGAPGTGAAMAASGGKNTGILANTANFDRYAVEATNLSTMDTGGGAGGGVWADGGDGVGVAALSPMGVPAVVSIGDTYYVQGHEVVLTASSLVYGATSANGPEVSFAGYATLDIEGRTTVELTGPSWNNGATWADVGNTNGGVSVTAINQPMPNLWMNVDEGGTVTISGGAPGGTVSWRVAGNRNDWASFEPMSATRAAGGSRIAKGKDLAARILRRAGRD